MKLAILGQAYKKGDGSGGSSPPIGNQEIFILMPNEIKLLLKRKLQPKLKGIFHLNFKFKDLRTFKFKF
jgi:hypothetical protein